MAKIPPKTRLKTRDELAQALGLNVRNVAYHLAAGMPGTPGFYHLEDCQAWLVQRATLARQKRKRRSGGGLNPR